MNLEKIKGRGEKVSLLVTDKKPSVVGVSQIEMIGKVKPNGYDAQSRPEVRVFPFFGIQQSDFRISLPDASRQQRHLYPAT